MKCISKVISCYINLVGPGAQCQLIKQTCSIRLAYYICVALLFNLDYISKSEDFGRLGAVIQDLKELFLWMWVVCLCGFL